MKTNCWDFKKCGRQPGGFRVAELGVCPAAERPHLDGTHGGKNAGRACWVIAGTFCGGTVQGTFAQKYTTCEQCDFYRQVKQEERHMFVLAATLLSELKKTA